MPTLTRIPNRPAAALLAAVFASAAVAVFAFVPTTALAQPRPKLVLAVQRAVTASGLPRSGTGVVITAVGEDGPAVAINATRKFVPASTMKVVTASTALDRLGPGYRWRTTLSCDTTPTDEGVIAGNLYLVGGGDPTLGTRARARSVGISPRGSYLDDLAARLEREGITRVTGAIVADESMFDSKRIGPRWKASYVWECAPLSALSADRNYADGGGWEANPPLAAARRFRTMLSARHIRIGGGLKRGREPSRHYQLATEYSPPLYRVIAVMNNNSDNFYAEMLAKTTAAELARRPTTSTTGTGGGTDWRTLGTAAIPAQPAFVRAALAAGPAPGSTAGGARAAASELASAGVAPRYFTLVDGSGLSRSNRLAPTALVGLLDYAAQRPFGRFLENSFPVAGVSGTLSDRMRGTVAERKVRAKTGTLMGVSTLAGYATCRTGTRFAFAVMTNGAGASSARAFQDRICVVLAGYRGR